jgi:hypothetical protein
MPIAVELSWTLSIKIGNQSWEPKDKITIGDDLYVNICVSDLKFVKIVVEASGIDMQFPKAKNTRLSLRYTDGVQELLKLRNANQAVDMYASTSDEPDPQRLFGNSAPDAKRQKRTALEVASMREKPDVFLVELPDRNGVPGGVAWMKRPVNATDVLFIKADHDSLVNVFKFIVTCGISIESLTAKRAWGTSGVKDTWKFGGKYYTKTDDGTHKYTRAPIRDHNDGDAEDDENDGVDDGEVGFDIDNIEAADEE